LYPSPGVFSFIVYLPNDRLSILYDPVLSNFICFIIELSFFISIIVPSIFASPVVLFELVSSSILFIVIFVLITFIFLDATISSKFP